VVCIDKGIVSLREGRKLMFLVGSFLKEGIEELKKEQIKLAPRIIIKDEFYETNVIGGVDQAFFDNKIISAAVVCDRKRMEIMEREYVIVEAQLEYVPGLLCFREGPAIIEVFKMLKTKPDVLLVEGHGIAHMRKFGLASYVGLMLNQPTIGVAKNLLEGRTIDKAIYINEEKRGYELKTRKGAKAIYISPGYRVSLKSSLGIVKSCFREHRLPEPLYLAHRYANKIKRTM